VAGQHQVDAALDVWEQLHGRSTVKNTVAALVLVLDVISHLETRGDDPRRHSSAHQ
jgi:hypothetical protein